MRLVLNINTLTCFLTFIVLIVLVLSTYSYTLIVKVLIVL